MHVQLSTQSKIFCASSTQFGAEPNQFIDALTFGLPGSLPVLNRAVVEDAMRVGLAMNCEIRNFNRFARKHYFYPDLPKGYQISQFEEPICERGSIEIDVHGSRRTIGVKRIHMEEDAGKNIHDSRTEASLIDLNRAGVPLLEIVSEPDLRSAEEAGAYLRTIRQLVRWLGVSDGNMEEGSLRCDANISLRPAGSLKFGTRTEIKNLNSFKFVERALEYEIARQLGVLRAGKEVIQQTLLFDSVAGTTHPLRSKEESSDYRYFPDPDLPPLHIEEAWINTVSSNMPKLPEHKVHELVEGYGLTEYDARVLTAERSYVDYYEAVFAECKNAKLACSWVTSELFGALKKLGLDVLQSPVKAPDLGRLAKLIDTEVISGKMGKTVFEQMIQTAKTPEQIIESLGLKQITSADQILDLVRKALDGSPQQCQEYVAGDERLHGYFVGQVMKLSSGSANPKKVNELIKSEIAKRRDKK